MEATRSTFTFSSVDGLNFIAAPLQCDAGAPACSGDGGFAFDIATVLNQVAVNAAAGFALMSDAAEILWVYCAQGSTDCPGTGTIPGFSAFVPGGLSDVDFLPFGIGAILKIKVAAVRTLTDATDSQFPGPLPVAVRFSVSGDINPVAPPSSPILKKYTRASTWKGSPQSGTRPSATSSPASGSPLDATCSSLCSTTESTSCWTQMEARCTTLKGSR